MVTLRRLVFLPLLALLLGAAPPAAQDRPDPDALRPSVSRAAQAKLAAAKGAIRKEDWPTAVRLLQPLLDSSSDALVRGPAEAGGQGRRWISAGAAAQRLLANLPTRGRVAYQKAYGAAAAALLARAGGSTERLEVVVRRYLYTEAGPDALRKLAVRYYKGDQFDLSARAFALLLRERGLGRWSADELYQATLALRRGGYPEAARTRQHLLGRIPPGVIRLAGRQYSRAELAKDLAPLAPPAPSGEWPLYRADPARSGRGEGGAPVLTPSWKSKTFYTRETGEALDKAVKLLRAEKFPILPGAVPLAVTVPEWRTKKPRRLVIYRSSWGIHALDIKTGKTAWRQPSSWGLDRMFGTSRRNRDANKVQAISKWLATYLESDPARGWRQPALVFGNSTLGTLSSDGIRVFAIEDLCVAPLPVGGRGLRGFTPDIMDALLHNKLQAFDMSRGGKLVWEIGGRGEGVVLPDTYFRGPPLPLGDQLHVLTQKGRALDLWTLESASGAILKQRNLGRLGSALLGTPVRRAQAVHLASGQGMLVVPTNAGGVLGFDLPSDKLAWAFTYPRTENGFRRWQVTAPVVVGDRVVFTAPDGDRLYCLGLRDGALRWSRPRHADDLYLAGAFGGRVLVVGKTSCRALRLDSGARMWTVATGEPSGQGVAGDGVYYLPLRTGAGDKRPEVCVVDLVAGKVRARIRGAAGEVPGNLLLLPEGVVSQSLKEIILYPPARAARKRLDKQK
jgi:outer membrane protein assembly factor BamB